MAWSSIGSEYGASTLQAVDVGMARPEDLAGKDLNGQIAGVTRESTPFSYTKSAELIAAVTDAGAKAVIPVNDRPGPFATQVVTLRNPDSGYVSLRVKAWDANGSKIEQTLIRAYAVR
ncbi:hypothetical protein OIC43_02780 [Streptomyces sp. NBC_00825]|uniref:hypothetical protein n=1 Tax=unclassified Streptomyces TaxID=2593676 RepID=UPI00224E00D5|nr:MULTISPECIES: hypothetical protein [unclassified Streptomyces]WTB59060.1 hypothetical protein OG832_40935 [Streptomyces sp. NBC_00826]WTH88065.1 hypothetical protein OIC43_02780 [Streptomyces sp. NBC_00825]WTH96792.1 hypothetical protein OHA23_02780 [Streptomyces sp. NBC_00822]MCX4870282.1 hypothetical protein [Streptomyces sp. NBC_00906]MCX4901445.1 hypothetical protein [Streptomyces sp. NBC_00892]